MYLVICDLELKYKVHYKWLFIWVLFIYPPSYVISESFIALFLSHFEETIGVSFAKLFDNGL